MSNKIKMMVEKSAKSLTLVDSDIPVVDSTGEIIEEYKLVLIGNYTKEGKYGYFICTEKVNDGSFTGHEYSNPLRFFENTNKKVYQEAANAYKAMIDDTVAIYRIS